MKRHDTPQDVAFALSRHVPRSVRTLLDPSVGIGMLLAPLVGRLKKQKSIVHCIDNDPLAIAEVSKNYRPLFSRNSRFIVSDFLSWSENANAPQFDCIIMNPPFAGGRANFYRLKLRKNDQDAGQMFRFVPLEAAFLYRALDLLKEKGRLLAIVPCSIVMSEGLQWFRDKLLSQGAVRFVHELPPRSFPGVDSRMYLMVFDKNCRNRKVVLLNHDLHRPERLIMSLEKGRGGTRLDYGYVNAMYNLGRLRAHKWMGWVELEKLSEIWRGDIVSPKGPKFVVHSSDFRNGFWRRSDRHNPKLFERMDRRLCFGDILFSRVGRNVYRTCGRGIRLEGMACSDCIVVLRPKVTKEALKVLFALRVVLSNEWAKPLVERGTGATYISHNSLMNLPIPIGICTKFPHQFKMFKQGEWMRSKARSQQAVQAVSMHIGKLLLKARNNSDL